MGAGSLGSDATEDHLKAFLSAAVPLWIEEFKRLSWQEIMAIAHESSQVIAEKGDVILYKSKKKGETAAAANALARGIAAGAFSPGGIKIFGLHYEAKHGE